MSKNTTFKRLLRPSSPTATGQKKSPIQKAWGTDMNRGEENESSPASGPSADTDQSKGNVPTADVEAGSVASDPGDRGESCVGLGLSASQIYTDLSVCRCLGIKRRVLAEARTAATRGRDWDAVGEEVGMTREWVYDYAIKHGIVPDFFGNGMEPVTGKYVSVRLIGTTPNKCLVQVELEATKNREFARTRNIMDHPIHYKEVFSCLRIMLPADIHLEWVAAPNEMKY